MACRLALGPWFVELGRLQLLAIDLNPGTVSGPAVAHDLELQGYGRQLLRRRVTYFYCEFFHIFILPFNCVCFRALEAWSLWLGAWTFFRKARQRLT